MSSTTDKQNCPALLKILSHSTAFGILSFALQNHCCCQHKLPCCPLWLDQSRRKNVARQRFITAQEKHWGATHTGPPPSASGTSCGEVTQTGNLTYPVVEVCTSRSTEPAQWLFAKKESLCCSQIHLSGSHLGDSLLSAISYLVQPLTSMKGCHHPARPWPSSLHFPC